MVSYLPTIFPAMSILDSKGLRTGILIGSLLITIGMFIRCFINYNFVYVIIGEVIICLG